MRIPIAEEAIDRAFDDAKEHLKKTLKRHGPGTFASRHELESVVRTECAELSDAVKTHAEMADIRYELLDVACPAIFGIACIDAGTMDW